MTLASGQEDTAKTTLYRLGVDQIPADRALASTKTYCQELLSVAPGRLQLDRPWTQNRPSPDPTAANNLFTFLAQRFNFTWSANGINCAGLLKVSSPVTLQVDDYGVAIRAWISLSPGGAPQASGRGAPEEGGA
jgi:hypothetical protein